MFFLIVFWHVRTLSTVLALASQSLSIMVALIPYVRETFRRHLSPNQAVMLVEFDKLKRVRPGWYEFEGYRTYLIT